MSFLKRATRMFLLSIILLVSCSRAANHMNTPVGPAASATGGCVEQVIQVRENTSQLHWPAQIELTKLVPESEVVRVSFDADCLQYNQHLQTLDTNKTKQVQEFETHRPATNWNEVGVASSSVTSAQPNSSQATIGQQQQQQQQQSTTTELPGWPIQSGLASTLPPPTSIDTPTTSDGPVGSKTSRQGSAILCGEANSNGKSNQRLSDRIVGGYKTEPGEFPFQVRLNIRSRRGSGICGGVILNEQHILTAAHCMTACVSQQLTTATIESTGVRATIGDHSIRSNDGEIEVDVEKIIPHEKYDACNFYANDHDIALIKTSTPIEFRFTTDGYGSINRPCMPPSSNVTYRDSEQVIVSGWGVTRENSGALSNILRYVQVPVVNITRCQETYGSRVTQDHVCAGLQSGGKDSCQGDSGGPLVRVVDNRYELVGIVSFGYGCGQPSAPGVYTRVASYIDWIKANL